MTTFLRLIKFALQDIARNLGLSLMTVFVLVLMLMSVNTLWSIDLLTKEAVALTKQQVLLSLYLTPAADAKSIAGLKSYLESLKSVTNVTELPREAVLKNFQDRHRLNKEILEALNELGGNPFGPTVVVSAKEPKDYSVIMTALDVPEYSKLIESKSFAEHEDALNRLQSITNRIEKIGFGLIVVFAIIAFLIIFNTIRVAIHTQHMEISIKRLVGANNWFIRGPYLIEAIIFSLLSMGITYGLVKFALRYVDPYVAVVFPNGYNLTNYFNSHTLSVFGAEILAVLALTLVSTALAMRRQLRV